MTLPQSDRQISRSRNLVASAPAVPVVLAGSCSQAIALARFRKRIFLRRTIASRIMREAGQGETDEQELRRKAGFGICDPPNAVSSKASQLKLSRLRAG